MNINNEELIKKKIADKDKANLRYKEKLNSIKQHYGVEFYVEHLNNNDIENIKFTNLEYRNGYENICVSYNPSNKKICCIEYDFLDTRIVKNLKHKRFISELENKYKLNLLVGEIERTNNDYIKELEEIDNYYNELSNASKISINELELNKNNKNE